VREAWIPVQSPSRNTPAWASSPATLEAAVEAPAAELTGDGRYLVVADGTVRAVPSGGIVWEFADVGGAS